MNGIENQAHQACINYLVRRTVGVVNEIRTVGTHPITKKRGDTEEPGTGCPLRWRDRYLILTARHVIDKASPNNLRVFSFPDEAVTFKSPKDISKGDTVAGLSLNDKNAEIRVCDWEDLAAISVAVDDFHHVDFVDIATEWIDPAEGEMVHCCGFPSDHSVTVEKRILGDKEELGVGLFPTVFSGKVLPLPSDDELKFKVTSFEPSRHYLMPYEVAPVSQHPRGVSGAATWWQNAEKMIIWRPSFRFAGTRVCSYKNGTVVQVVKASVVRRFLEEVFGPAS